MYVIELNTEQLEELKMAYFYQLIETDEEVLRNYEDWLDIPDEIIFEHYDGIWFVNDDFACTAGK